MGRSVGVGCVARAASRAGRFQVSMDRIQLLPKRIGRVVSLHECDEVRHEATVIIAPLQAPLESGMILLRVSEVEKETTSRRGRGSLRGALLRSPSPGRGWARAFGFGINYCGRYVKIKKVVQITIQGGVIQDVDCPDGVEPSALSRNESGDEYVESVWD